MTTKTQKVTTAALFLALGTLIPFFTGHVAGIQGTVLLPMHFSVLIAGFCLGPVYGFYIGMLTPVLSCLLTGMPGLYPMLPIMAGELAVYGFLTGYLYRKGLGIYRSLILAMAAGRVVHAMIFAGLLLAGSKPVTAATCLVFLIQGIPGTILQLLIIPPIVWRLGGACMFDGVSAAKAEGKEPGGTMDREIAAKREQIQGGQVSLVVIREGKTVCEKKGMGIAPLLEIVTENRDLLENALVVDKIVGKAAAMLMTLGKVKEVYALTVSEDGRDYLIAHGIQVTSDRCIGVIKNRDKTGICPFENAVAQIDHPEEGLEVLQNTMKRLRKGA